MPRKSLHNRRQRAKQQPLKSDSQTHAAPPCPSGLVYTVVSGDTLFTIAKRFGMPLQSIIDANPQLNNPDLILPGQNLCVPMPNIPHIVTIQLLNNEGAPLPQDGPFTRLPCETIVRIQVVGPASHAFIFLTPTGTDSFPFTQLVGVVTAPPDGNLPDFQWQVPANVLGFLFAVVCNGQNCRQSEMIGVFSEECP